MMKSINQKEDELFERWKKSKLHEKYGNGFISDGMVNEDAYTLAYPKILFILKEANDKDDTIWDLRNFLRESGGRKQTWDNAARWIAGIKNIFNDTMDSPIRWAELKDVDDAYRKAQLQPIIAMNIKNPQAVL